MPKKANHTSKKSQKKKDFIVKIFDLIVDFFDQLTLIKFL